MPQMPLQKLMIRGIRAFSPAGSNVIEFSSPLVLIVGENGTGKTTVIESLKFALTGTFPPNSKGGAFLYDPKMLREPDVRAEIKLKFTDASNRVLVVRRVLQSIQRGGKLFQKTLETELCEETGSTQRVMATRLSDVDSLIPALLGSSSALLEGVTLCHQEDNTWPLSESRILKERLDGIFCSTKYSKALKAMKEAKRDVSGNIKVLEERLKQLSREKSRRDDLAAKATTTVSELNALKTRLKVLNDEIARIGDILGDLRKEEDVYNQLENNYRSLISEMQGCLNFIRSFRYEVLSDEAIDELLPSPSSDSYQNKLQSIKVCLSDKISGYKEIDINKLECYQNSLEKAISYNESFNSSRKVAEELDRRISDAEKEGVGYSEEDEKMLIKKKEEAEREMLLYDASYHNVKEYERANKSILVKYAKSIKYEDVMMREEECTVDEELLSLSEKIREKERIMGVFLDEQYKQQERLSRKSEQLNRLRMLRGEYQLLEEKENGRGELRNKLELMNEELQTIRENRSIIDEHVNTIKSIVHNTQNKITKIPEQVKEELKGGIALIKLIETLELISTNMNGGIEGLDLVGEGIKCLREIRQNLVVNEFEITEPERIIKEMEELRKQEAATVNAEAIYQNFRELGNKRQECPLCKTELEGSKLDYFNKKLSYVLLKLPEKLALQQEKITAKEKEIRELESKRMAQVEVAAWKSDLKALLESCIKECESLMLKMKNSKNTYIDEKNREEVEIIKNSLLKLDFNKERMNLIEQELRSLECSISSSEGLYDSLEKKIEELKSKYETAKEEKKVLENKYNSTIKIKEEMEEVAILRKWAVMKGKIKGVNREELSKRVMEAREEYEKYIKRKMKHSIRMTQLTNLRTERDRVCKMMANYKTAILSDKVLKIVKLYSDNKEINNLGENAEKVTGVLVTTRDIICNEKRTAIEMLYSIQKDKETLTLIDENIKLRKYKERVRRIEKEFGDFDLKKKQQISDKIEKYREKEASLTSKKSMLLGEVRQMEKLREELQRDLDENYRSTNKEYAKCSVELRAAELSIKDMDRSIKALDQAIVEYHRSKLEEVNSALRDLWSSTYKGGDIETIELRPDGNDLRACGYSVVMIKGNTEMDMRGRCSAGQKAISSILIRVALADSFSSECNVLSLDEPTTNLDRENIKSLAKMLRALVAKRKQMQLIVITHDEDFVNMIAQDNIEHFYRIKRNHSGDSHIERHSVISSDVLL